MERYYRNGYMDALHGRGFHLPLNPLCIIGYIDGYIAGRYMAKLLLKKNNWKI